MKHFFSIAVLLIGISNTVFASSLYLDGIDSVDPLEQEAQEQSNCLSHYDRQYKMICQGTLYRLAPANIIKGTYLEGKRLNAPIAGCISASIEVVSLFPAYILCGPWIVKEHIQANEFLKIKNILYEVFIPSREEDQLQDLLAELHLIYPNDEVVQNLVMNDLKALIKLCDQRRLFFKNVQDRIGKRDNFFEFLNCYELIKYKEFIETLFALVHAQ